MSFLRQSKQLSKLSSHQDKLMGLYEVLQKNMKDYVSADIQKVANYDQMLNVKLMLKQTDLQRYAHVNSSYQLLIDKNTKNVIKINQVADDESESQIMIETTEPKNSILNIKFRKVEKNVFIEVWNSQKGLVSSLKVSDKLVKVYNDTVFGGIQWSNDQQQIVFVGEQVEVESYQSWFQDKSKKEDESKKPLQSEKYKLQENFGETLESKKYPAIFIFNIEQNTLNKVYIDESDSSYGSYPIFDQNSTGIVFNYIHMPIKKLGLNYCLNRKTSLLYIQNPLFEKTSNQNYIINLNEGDYLGMQPRFSQDFQKLCYFASENNFLSHSGNYQLKCIIWSENKKNTVIDYQLDYPDDSSEFAGLYGYNMTFTNCNFIAGSNRYFLLQSEIRGQTRIYLVDVESQNKVRWVNFLHKHPRQGNYSLIQMSNDAAVISYSSTSEPNQCYLVVFSNVTQQLEDIKVNTILLDEQLVDQEIMQDLSTIQKDFVHLQNGAEGYFIRLSDEILEKSVNRGENGKHPMLVLIHGGPFSSSPQDMFLLQRNYFLLQGYCLLVVNYRGSIGFGKQFLDSLLGHIGERDVEDCGNLTIKALEQFSSVVDSKRVCVQGGSHGGFLTGWLIGHPLYNKLWCAAGLWNAVLDLNYMVTVTDIPDWIFACCNNQELKFIYDFNDNQNFFLKSPISQINNVTTPSIFLVGGGDIRVPPHQSYFFYNGLKQKQVQCELYNYPENGHALLKNIEQFNDANLNIALWMNKYAGMQQ